ncbi:hypothetical protein O0L34_g14661 [Tuta absoluta]|nr:hypothetical protein O0L34_g14661 [Tuta absoluta]
MCFCVYFPQFSCFPSWYCPCLACLPCCIKGIPIKWCNCMVFHFDREDTDSNNFRSYDNLPSCRCSCTGPFTGPGYDKRKQNEGKRDQKGSFKRNCRKPSRTMPRRHLQGTCSAPQNIGIRKAKSMENMPRRHSMSACKIRIEPKREDSPGRNKENPQNSKTPTPS